MSSYRIAIPAAESPEGSIPVNVLRSCDKAETQKEEVSLLRSFASFEIFTKA
jgi:hypothetical protein